MKLHLALLGLLRTVIPGHCAEIEAEVYPTRMIAVLIALEGGGWGEQGGAAHMGYAAWSQHSKSSYQLCRLERYAVPQYRLHLAWIDAQLRKANVTINPARVALCWRFGFEGAKAAKFSGDYGQRAENLYADQTFH